MNICSASGLTMLTTTTLGTALGLAGITGINAYMPLLILACAHRWFHLCTINPHFTFIGQDWFIIAMAILTIADLVMDKILVGNHLWNAVHTAIRPIAGAFIAAAMTNQTGVAGLPGAQSVLLSGHMGALMGLQPGVVGAINQAVNSGLLIFLMAVAGFLLAGAVHLTKMSIRGGAALFTADLSSIALSIVEDIITVLGVVLTLLAPAVMFIGVVLFVILFLLLFRHIMHTVQRIFGLARSW
ncbi:hypothetical protein KDH_73930 [Dictyobacter sp. S3.2.2.5]|uniref:DUF4126 domain-containing protein n=1 Tax=Dictyobacter halimunensis TaxID=3026934 RepID=A0ABQ6G213_9CHLR|nr:hypothetical protein KDH_73930 [Dictyobacter sp. S3.2.2.5]